jgi:hypothetical protein
MIYLSEATEHRSPLERTAEALLKDLLHLFLLFLEEKKVSYSVHPK